MIGLYSILAADIVPTPTTKFGYGLKVNLVQDTL